MAETRDAPTQTKPVIGGRGRERLDVPDTPLQERAQKSALHDSVELVHGPSEVRFGEDELVVLTVLRDGATHIRSFVEHHLALGAKHLVFLDNGSEDGTVEALRRYEDGVTVLRTGLPFKTYQISMRQYLVERFGRNRWTLSVDVDEHFDYPFSDVVELKALLRYLRERRYTAVVAQMLDMFPEEIGSDVVAIASDEPLKELNRFYDVSDVNASDYSLYKDEVGNEVSNEEIKVLQGGVQRRLFGLSPVLTKHPLIFLEDGVRPYDMSEHWGGGVRVADFTGLLLHYKLSLSLFGLVRREISKRTYPNRHGKYDKYNQVLEGSSRHPMKNEASRELRSTDQLLGSEFLVVSENYMRLVGEEARKQNPDAYPNRLTAALLRAGTGARRSAQGGETDWRVRRAEARREQLEDRVCVERRRLQEAQRRAGELAMQMAAMRSSRAWKTIEVLSRVKRLAAWSMARLRGNAVHEAGLERATQAAPGRGKSGTETKRTGKEGTRKDTTAFFIVGSGKSGTTWLMRMLNAHPEILCKGEGRLFNREWHRKDLEKPDAPLPPRSLYGSLWASQDLRQWMERTVWGKNGDAEALLNKMTRTAIDHVFDRNLAKSKLARSDGRIVGDKTPFLPGANVVEEIANVYPEAKVIHIIRDGRDVEVSWAHHRWNKATDRGGAQVLTSGEIERRRAFEGNDSRLIEELGMFDDKELRRRARAWTETVGGAVEAGPRLLGDNYAEVRYESLLEDAPAELRRLLELLGASTNEDIVQRCVQTTTFEILSGGRRSGEEDPASFLRKGVAGDWKRAFTRKDRQAYEEEAGDLLAELGYERGFGE